jgi:hypothetical protein
VARTGGEHVRSKYRPRKGEPRFGKGNGPFLQISQADSIQVHGNHLPIVRYKRSPMSPSPGLIIPLSFSSSSIPPTQTSVASGHSPAALVTPPAQPKMLIRITFCTPHSFNDCIAAAAVPPVAMTGSMRMARYEAEGLLCGTAEEFGRVKGRLL